MPVRAWAGTPAWLRRPRAIALLGLCLMALPAREAANAMPANPLPFEAIQPDGSRITLRICGDEYFHWHEDLPGYTVVLDNHTYVYAKLDPTGRLAPTGLVVGRTHPAQLRKIGLIPGILPPPEVRAKIRSRRLRASPHRDGSGRVPPSGTVVNLVVLCKFSDHVLGTDARPQGDYDTLFNAVGGDPTLAPTGSVRDCYTENSYGLMTLDSTVAPWVTLPQDEAYYTNGSSGLGGSYPANPQGMVKHALDLVDPLVDFGDFDTDNDGYVDAIDIIHSGYGAETGGGGGYWMWSHRWSLWALPGGEWTSNDLNGVGEYVKVYNYHTEPALWGETGTDIVRIGVIAHETGHFFGLPDLYDTDGGGEGIGSYGMMANSWGFDFTQLYPPHFSAWSKIFLGWATATVLTAPGVYNVPQVETTPTIFRIDTNYPPGEYLLIENRQPVGLDSAMPQGGLAIWHIDEAKSGNTDEGYPGQPGWPGNNNHYKVALLQADGNYDLEHDQNRGDSGDVYHAGGVFAIGESTVPNTDAYQGGNVIVTQNAISAISVAGSNMTFTFLNSPDCNGNGIPDAQDLSSGTSPDCNSSSVPDECELAGNDCNANTIPDDCDVDPLDPDGNGQISGDCQPDGIPDECQLSPEVIIWDNYASGRGSSNLSSQLDASYPFHSQVADDFLLNVDTQVTGVRWAGSYWNGGTVPDPDIGFNIYFYADDGTGSAPTNGGDPDDPVPSALAAYTFAHNCNETSAGDGTFDYSVELPTPFQPAVGVKYWIAIQSINFYPPQWGFRSSADQQLSVSTQGFPLLSKPYWIAGTEDVAFRLIQAADECNGNGVPDECDPDCDSNGVPDDCDVPSPSPAADVGADVTLCADAADPTLGGSPTGSDGTPPYTYAWSGSGAAFLDDPSAANPSFDISAANPGTYQVCVEVSDVNSCLSTVDCADLTVEACITVNLELEGLVGGSPQRSVTIVITSCPGTDVRAETVSFTPGAGVGTGSVLLTNVDPGAQWLSVQEGHGLRRLRAVDFSTSFATTTNFAGIDKLTAGDLQTPNIPQDNLSDILDFSILAARWNQPVTDCMVGDPNPENCEYGADITGDGIQDTADFTALQQNFFAVGDPADGCPALLSGGRPNLEPNANRAVGRISIPVAEMSSMLPNVARADVTGDGLVDLRDILAFAELHNLPLIPEFERKLRRLRVSRESPGSAGSALPPNVAQHQDQRSIRLEDGRR